MVEYTTDIDATFNALADPVRRYMLEHVAQREYSISELASYFDISFAAISKHIMVLESASLICKRKDGRKRMISLNLDALAGVDNYLRRCIQAKSVY